MHVASEGVTGRPNLGLPLPRPGGASAGLLLGLSLFCLDWHWGAPRKNATSTRAAEESFIFSSGMWREDVVGKYANSVLTFGRIYIHN